MKRREAREQAFILLFEQSLNHDRMEEIIETAELCGEGAFMVDAFAERVALCAEKNQRELDEKIEQNIKGWRMNRLSKASLSILRLAICEMLYEKDIPFSVSINEAVELAKKYGGKEDAPFVNGVLGSVARRLSSSQEKGNLQNPENSQSAGQIKQEETQEGPQKERLKEESGEADA